MERVVFVTIIATTLIAYATGSSSAAAVYSGLFWGALAYAVMWVRDRVKGRAKARELQRNTR